MSTYPDRLTRVFPRLFSALGTVGCGAQQEPEFRTPAELLPHLDRLGVTHSLVTDAFARDHDPTRGNARLLRDLDACSATSGGSRLFPALAISPTLQWERSGVQALRDAMTASGTRALRAYPGSLRYRMYQLDYVLQQVADLRPFVVFDFRDIADPRDLLDLAAALPEVPLIAAQTMWPHLTTLFDLMRRRPNILIETSWLHVEDILRDIVRNFGSERVVFGLGPAAHQGAAIAGLAHADLHEQDRQRIAYGNLAKLMGLPAGETPKLEPQPRPVKSRLWDGFVRDEPVPLEIIDAHGHLDGIATWSVHELDTYKQLERALPRMDRRGVRTMIISGLDALFSDPVEHNAALADRLRPFGERFRAYVVFNPFYVKHLEPKLDAFFADPVFAGFKLLNDYWAVPVTDPRFTPVWEYAHAHRLPILLHTWDTIYNSPAMLTDIAAKYGDAVFLLGHSGGGNKGRFEAEELANRCPNVYLEWCGSFTCSIPWEQTLRRVKHQQVVFGTDGVYHDLSWELGRMLSLDVDDEVITPMLGGTMKRILAMRK